MADDNDFQNINHVFEVNAVEHDTVYTATSSTFPSQATPNMLAMGMSYKEATHHNKYTRTPGIGGSSATNFPLYHEHDSTRTVIAVGPLVGQPLLTWMRNEFTVGTVWKYDIKGNLTGLQDRAMKLLCLMGVALAPIHERGGYVGDILKQARVDSNFTRITFDKFEELASPLIGMQKDIADFKELIITLETLDNVPQISNPQNWSVVDLFKDMCDAAQFLNDPLSLLDVSYFVCHHPIWWNYQQRMDFAIYAFYSLRERASNVDPKARGLFDSFVDFAKTETLIPNSWQNIIRPQNIIFYKLLQFRPLKNVYTNSIGLLPYHRSCYLHYHKEEQSRGQQLTPYETIDEELIKMFPDVIPKAWDELYFNMYDLGNGDPDYVVKELKARCVHYSKLF